MRLLIPQQIPQLQMKKETLIKPKGQSPYKTPGEDHLYLDFLQDCTSIKNFFQEIFDYNSLILGE